MVDRKPQRILSAQELAKAARCVVDNDGHEGVAASRGGVAVASHDVVGTW